MEPNIKVIGKLGFVNLPKYYTIHNLVININYLVPITINKQAVLFMVINITNIIIDIIEQVIGIIK